MTGVGLLGLILEDASLDHEAFENILIVGDFNARRAQAVIKKSGVSGVTVADASAIGDEHNLVKLLLNVAPGGSLLVIDIHELQEELFEYLYEALGNRSFEVEYGDELNSDLRDLELPEMAIICTARADYRLPKYVTDCFHLVVGVGDDLTVRRLDAAHTSVMAVENVPPACGSDCEDSSERLVSVYTKDVRAALTAFKAAIMNGALSVQLSSNEDYETKEFQNVNLTFSADRKSPAISVLDGGAFVVDPSALDEPSDLDESLEALTADEIFASYSKRLPDNVDGDIRRIFSANNATELYQAMRCYLGAVGSQHPSGKPVYLLDRAVDPLGALDGVYADIIPDAYELDSGSSLEADEIEGGVSVDVLNAWIFEGRFSDEEVRLFIWRWLKCQVTFIGGHEAEPDIEEAPDDLEVNFRDLCASMLSTIARWVVGWF